MPKALLPPKLLAPLARHAAWLAPLYLVLCFVATHWPPPPEPTTTLPYADKIAHVLIYTGLGLVFAALARLPHLRSRRTAVCWLTIAAYGAFDELTQAHFRRNPELADWVMDALGAAAGIGLWLHSSARR